jgi:hypothetical protein
MKERFDILMMLVEQAIEKGEFSETADAPALTDAIFGAIWSTTYLWKLENQEFNLKDRIISAVDVFLNGNSIK